MAEPRRDETLGSAVWLRRMLRLALKEKPIDIRGYSLNSAQTGPRSVHSAEFAAML